MENQHRLIAGDRELNADEISLMNRIKAFEREGLALIAAVEEHNRNTHAKAFADDDKRMLAIIDFTKPWIWHETATMDFQTSVMKLTRAVAMPVNVAPEPKE